MDPHLTPEPSSLSNASAISPGYNGQDDPASQLQAKSSLDNIQSKPFCLMLHPVLTCRVRVRIRLLAYLEVRPEATRSVRFFVSPYSRYALVYIFVY